MKTLSLAAALVTALAHSAIAQQQFTVGSTNVAVGVMAANAGDGYAVYHYRAGTGPNSVTVTCSCPGSSPRHTTKTCAKVLFQCGCPTDVHPCGCDIGLEMHPDTDQFLRLDAGRGRVQIGPSKDQLTFDRKVSDGWCVLIPAGTFYAPAHHKPGKVHRTAADAASDSDDEPAEWSVQPSATHADQHS